MLSDIQIKARLKISEITIEPFKSDSLGPNSYDLTVYEKVKVLVSPTEIFDLSRTTPNYIEKRLPCELMPGESVIAATEEVVGCKSRTLGIISSRSNLARSGLQFSFSSLLDTGFKGRLSVMIHNPTDQAYLIPKGLRLIQIMFDDCKRINQTYDERKWSKNMDQFTIDGIRFKPDKEFREL